MPIITEMNAAHKKPVILFLFIAENFQEKRFVKNKAMLGN